MTIHNVFSPFIFKANLNNNDFLKQKILPQIHKQRKKSNSLVPSGWFCDVFSTYQYENKTKSKYDEYGHLDNRETEKFGRDFDNTCLMHTYIDQVNIFLEELSLLNNRETMPVSAFNIDMWYNTYTKNQYQEWHTHSGGSSDFSAIHFLKYDENVHLPTVFRNPTSKSQIFSSVKNKQRLTSINNIKNTVYSEVFYPNIREGDLIIFPSWLEHTVPPNKSKELRVTVAFNIELL